MLLDQENRIENGTTDECINRYCHCPTPHFDGKKNVNFLKKKRDHPESQIYFPTPYI